MEMQRSKFGAFNLCFQMIYSNDDTLDQPPKSFSPPSKSVVFPNETEKCSRKNASIILLIFDYPTYKS